jgi:PAS domain S-box-containing protein
MLNAPIPKDEHERLAAVRRLALLDTPPEERFDRITRLAATHFHLPISTVTLVDSGREWFKSCYGLTGTQGDRAASFCGHALLEPEMLVVPDASKDARFSDNPLVTEDGIRFYAGVPLFSVDGKRVGVFCVKGLVPKDFSAAERDDLKGFAAWAETELNHFQTSNALAELQGARDEVTEIMDSISDAFIAISPDLRDVHYLSPVFSTFLGVPSPLLREDPSPIVNAVFPEDLSTLRMFLKRVEEKRAPLPESQEPVFRAKRYDGAVRWIRSKTIPVLNEDGDVDHFVGVLRDVTDQQEFDARLRESESRYRLLFENLQFGLAHCRMIFEGDIPMDFTYLETNAAFERLTGLKGVDGKNGADVIPTIRTVNPELIKTYGRVTTTGIPEKFESYVKPLKRWLYISVYQAEPGCFVAVLDNITDRKEGEVKLANAYSRTRAVFDSQRDAVFVISPDRVISEMNRSAEDMFGYRLDEVLGKSSEMLHVDAEHFKRFGDYAYGEGFALRNEAIEWDMRRKDGRIFPAEFRFSTLTDEKGEQSGWVVVIRDVTERMKSESRIKELGALKEKFIRIVSHQFHAPLNAIRSNLETLLADHLGSLRPEQREFIRMARDTDVELTDRVDDLLTALDIEEGRITISKADVSMEGLLRSVIGASMARAAERKVALEYLAPEKALPTVLADQDRMRTVFEKLVQNAVIYTPPKGSITARLIASEDALRFEITDTGIGIPTLEQTGVFKSFFRASNAHAASPNASGLGLYIAKYFVEQQGGSIGFASEEGKGSTFWFEMPLR